MDKNLLYFKNIILKSLLDFAVSTVLLLVALTVKDYYVVENTGVLGWIECRLWKTDFFILGTIWFLNLECCGINIRKVFISSLAFVCPC